MSDEEKAAAPAGAEERSVEERVRNAVKEFVGKAELETVGFKAVKSHVTELFGKAVYKQTKDSVKKWAHDEVERLYNLREGAEGGGSAAATDGAEDGGEEEEEVEEFAQPPAFPLHPPAVMPADPQPPRAPATGLPTFELERFFAEYEFKVSDGLMCCSDPESWTLPEVLELATPETRRLYESLSLGYTESQGLPRLREEVAAMCGGGTAPDHVLVVAPEEGIYAAMRCLLREGDHVVVLAPAYQSLYAIAEGAGCDVSLWHLKEGPGGWEVDLEALRGLVGPRTRLIVVNTPHNPTGAHLTRDEQRAVVEVARGAGAWLFSDEMYRMLERDPAADRLPPAHTLDYERVVSLSGVSKTMGGPGLRIGWLCTKHDGLMSQLRAYKDYLTICSPAPSEVLALALVERRDEVTRRLGDLVAAGLRAVRGLAARVPWAVALVEPRAGSTCFLRLTLPGVDDAEFARRLVDEEGLLVLPGSRMGCPGYVRLGLGRRNMPELVERLAAYVERRYPAPRRPE